MVIFDTNTNQKAHLVSTMKRMKAVLKKGLRIFILTIIGLTSTIALGQSVTISSISPTSAIPGDTITITGTGFATAANGYLDLSSAEANIISSTIYTSSIHGTGQRYSWTSALYQSNYKFHC